MHSIEFDKSIIKGVKLINVEKIIIHEEIIEQKARNKIRTHVIIGEGASGGALGIGVGDKVLMLENTWYSRNKIIC